MPELPEVETIVGQLRPKIVGRRIFGAKVLDQKIVNLRSAEFQEQISGSTIREVRRRAKVVIWELAPLKFLIFHLKLNGRILLVPDKEPPHHETRVIFEVSGPDRIFFDDSRRFAWIKLLKGDEFEKFMADQNYGPEPLDKNFSLEEFKKILTRRPNAKIKQLVMDQEMLAGVGNIYAQEACFFAGILPTRAAKTLTDSEIKKFYNSLLSVLKQAIEDRGTSVDAYVDINGRQGSYEPKLRVYGREGQKCRKCGSVIKFMKLGGRGTRWCPGCQK
ncbi:MAG: bifunctional DNA-formamidopyrimidine glycosylase/DNA-(apurinic or apyrimidinic site) lyase [Patescibacteria group bacterium]|nr:bifunctional DNA-formamidopyrimidine glycosylase/DNA-(apurinic or apyrimidinic site) lyase [Patescibacteria group bacterium]